MRMVAIAGAPDSMSINPFSFFKFLGNLPDNDCKTLENAEFHRALSPERAIEVQSI